MRGRTVRLLSALVAVLATWLCAPQAAVGNTPSLPTPIHVYDDHQTATQVDNTPCERGPPALREHTTTYDAVGHWSRCALACPDAPMAPSIYDYDGIPRRLQATRGSDVFEVRSGVAPSNFVATVRLRVAAKAGPALGPARSTDLVLDSFRKLGPGRNAHVRTAGSVDELQDTFNAWIVGAERIASRGPKVPDVYRLPDGGVIQWRTSSGTGGPTIDIFPVSGRQRTVHLADGVPW